MDANEVYEKELNKFQKNVSQIKTKRIMASEENNPQLMNSLHMSTKGTIRSGRLLTSDTLQKHSSLAGSEVCYETQNANHAKEIQSLKFYYEEIIELLKDQLKEAEEALQAKNKEVERMLLAQQEMNEIV